MKCNGNHDHYKGKCLEIDWVGTAAGAERYPKPQVSNKDYTEEIKQINAANRLRVKERLLKENVKPW